MPIVAARRAEFDAPDFLLLDHERRQIDRAVQTAYNYRERGLAVLLLTAALDKRAGEGVIASRIGLHAPAATYDATDDLLAHVRQAHARAPLIRVLVDEAQFLTKVQVWQLADVVDVLGIEVTCYGLRTDFRGELFEGSAALMSIADDLRPLHTVCHCGREATMVVRQDENGRAITTGEQIRIGGNELYMPLCRLHWSEGVARNATVENSAPAKAVGNPSA